MKPKLSNDQIKRIAKSIKKGLGAGDIDWEETFEQDEASAEFKKNEQVKEQIINMVQLYLEGLFPGDTSYDVYYLDKKDDTLEGLFQSIRDRVI